MTARKYVPIRLDETAVAYVQTLADDETGGNLSEMIRKLLSEAVRVRKSRR